MNQMRKSRAGQALVIFALSFTFLFGLLVVGIEGGMMYVDRRQLQNAADAAALAGAYALESLPLPTYSPAHQKALRILVDNLPGTTMPGTIPATANFSQSLGNGYNTTVVATGGTGWDSYRVTVTHVFNLQLGTGLGFSNPTLVALAKAQSGTYPFALILLQDDAVQNDNLAPGGNTGVQLLRVAAATAGGGAFTNAGFGMGSGGGASLTFSPCGNAGDVWAVNENPASATALASKTKGQQGDPGCPAGSTPASYPKSQSSKLPFPNYPEPAVTGTSYGTALTGSGTDYLCPGTYTSTITNSNGNTIVLTPGVYRFTASNAVNLSGGSFRSAVGTDYQAASPYNINAGGTLINCSATPTKPADGDYGVIVEFAPTACAAPASNQFTMSGGATVDLYPSPKYNKIGFYIELYGGVSWHTTCPYNAVGPVLAGTHVINISGNGAYSIRGAIYGPADNGSFSGNGGGYGVGQMIVWTATVVGNGTLKENYDPSYLPYFRGLIQ